MRDRGRVECSYLPGVIQIIVLLLKQRMQSARVDRLQLVLSQMQYALKEGNQRFILAYTLYDCVAAVQSSVHLTPEDVSFHVSTDE